ncbi:MAG: glycosyltransferase [Chloroflexi bacterium]|nr:glycosyltransferase [Chloroflexota bacterium]
MKISVVVPVYYNAASLPLLHERLAKVAAQIAYSEFEFIFVDDGSGDDSFEVLRNLTETDSRVKAIRLVRNSGSNPAILAGLAHAQGDASVVITADLQDPPELLPEMVTKWCEGYKVVLAVRTQRSDPWITRLTGDVFNWLYKRLVFPNFPQKGFDFFLADKEVIRVLVQNAGPNLYLFGLLLWAGFKSVTVSYERAERKFGKSRWTLGKKIKYFMDAFVGFSYLPLRITSVVGMLLALFGFLYAGFVVIARIVWGFPVEGWTSLMVVLLLVSGVQLVMLGILGEYLWRNLDETRRRPLYLIGETLGFENHPRETPVTRVSIEKMDE